MPMMTLSAHLTAGELPTLIGWIVPSLLAAAAVLAVRRDRGRT